MAWLLSSLIIGSLSYLPISDVATIVEREIRSQCELRPVVEVLPQGTLPPTQFKAKRVRDLRQTPAS